MYFPGHKNWYVAIWCCFTYSGRATKNLNIISVRTDVLESKWKTAIYFFWENPRGWKPRANTSQIFCTNSAIAIRKNPQSPFFKLRHCVVFFRGLFRLFSWERACTVVLHSLLLFIRCYCAGQNADIIGEPITMALFWCNRALWKGNSKLFSFRKLPMYSS